MVNIGDIVGVSLTGNDNVRAQVVKVNSKSVWVKTNQKTIKRRQSDLKEYKELPKVEAELVSEEESVKIKESIAIKEG